ncbi:hypothetical protein HNR77_001817 [Paenibacillus sp. JGP012]|nr:hypothetical protein [Paenibacillus sp. JGP012]
MRAGSRRSASKAGSVGRMDRAIQVENAGKWGM